MLETSCVKRTCILVVQPWTISIKDNSLFQRLLSCVKMLKERGVLVGCVCYSYAVSEEFARLSDFAFFMESSNLAQGEGILHSKARALCHNSKFIPLNYPGLVPLLDFELEKRGIDYLLIIGGFREDCVLAVVKYMCKLSKLPNLKVRLIEKLIVSQRALFTTVSLPKKFAHYREYYGCDVLICEKDPDLILKYFK